MRRKSPPCSHHAQLSQLSSEILPHLLVVYPSALRGGALLCRQARWQDTTPLFTSSPNFLPPPSASGAVKRFRRKSAEALSIWYPLRSPSREDSFPLFLPRRLRQGVPPSREHGGQLIPRRSPLSSSLYRSSRYRTSRHCSLRPAERSPSSEGRGLNVSADPEPELQGIGRRPL